MGAELVIYISLHFDYIIIPIAFSKIVNRISIWSTVELQWICMIRCYDSVLHLVSVLMFNNLEATEISILGPAVFAKFGTVRKSFTIFRRDFFTLSNRLSIAETFPFWRFGSNKKFAVRWLPHILK